MNKIIKNARNKAGGVDNISNKAIKRISDSIAESSAIILNLCIVKSI